VGSPALRIVRDEQDPAGAGGGMVGDPAADGRLVAVRDDRVDQALGASPRKVFAPEAEALPLPVIGGELEVHRQALSRRLPRPIDVVAQTAREHHVEGLVGPEDLSRLLRVLRWHEVGIGAVAELGREITDALVQDDPVVVGVLKGSVPFLTDLSRHLPLTIEIDFLNLTRFGREGRVSIAMDLSVPIEGRSVVIVEDIVDTGLTLATLRKMLFARGASSVSTAALLDKSTRRIVDVPVEHRGFEVGDEFLLGYGMDWHGRYRNVPSIWAVMDLSVLTSDPDAFRRHAFREADGPAG